VIRPTRRRTPRFAALALFALASAAHAQTEGVLPVGDPVHRFLERQQTRGHLREAHLSHQPLSAYAARALLDSLAADSAAVAALAPADRRLLARLRGETPGPGAALARRYVPFVYRNGQDLLRAEGDGYGLVLTPLAYLQAGRASQSTDGVAGEGLTVWRNTRGARAAGHLGRLDRTFFFFETRIEENQRVEPAADNALVGARIGERYFRDGRTYDYWVATGLVGVKTRFVEARLGRDRARWGAARGPLLVSGFPTTFDQLQLRTRVWRVEYVNVFSALADPTQPRDSLTNQIRARYGVFHRLALDLPGRVQVGLSESAILAPTPEDRGPEFYLAYLNPIIFYRALDFEWGSPANMLIALDAQWVPVGGVQLYGQLMLDEFRAGDLFSGDGSYTNKWGGLLGLHLADVAVPGLEVRAEYARIRPYTYSSVDPERAYVHFLGTMGHPYGPNAEGLTVWADYRPTDRLTASVEGTLLRRGRNDGAVNYGSDPLVPYTTGVPNESGTFVGQGIRQTETRLDARVGYELLPGLVAEAITRWAHTTDAADPALNRDYVSALAGLRWGLPYQSARF